MADQKNNDRKTSQLSPKPSSVDTLTPKSSKSSIKQLDNQSSASPEAEKQNFDTLAKLLGHKNTETLEDID